MGGLFSAPTITPAEAKRLDDNMVMLRSGRKDETGAKYHGNWPSTWSDRQSGVTPAVDAMVPIGRGQRELLMRPPGREKHSASTDTNVSQQLWMNNSAGGSSFVAELNIADAGTMDKHIKSRLDELEKSSQLTGQQLVAIRRDKLAKKA